ncbi:hypothetical protein [Prosthecomicrobium sp. N25]|uniref:hypothetical protein n=1 Tax=Prosthecomicrobium sp. N25 TaxID=3129254 RepID=UPI0030784526
MPTIEIVLGDFAPGPLALDHTLVGRPVLRSQRPDGSVETIHLRGQVAGCAEHDEGSISGYLARWMAQGGLSLDAVVADMFRHERLFVVVLADGRKFVARATPEIVAELKTCARPPRRPDAARPSGPGTAAVSAPPVPPRASGLAAWWRARPPQTGAPK